MNTPCHGLVDTSVSVPRFIVIGSSRSDGRIRVVGRASSLTGGLVSRRSDGEVVRCRSIIQLIPNITFRVFEVLSSREVSPGVESG